MFNVMGIRVRPSIGFALFMAIYYVWFILPAPDPLRNTHILGFAVFVLVLGLLLAADLAGARKRDRVVAVLYSVSFCLFWNFLQSWHPTDRERFGYGCPWKWCYDPGFRLRGLHRFGGDLHAWTGFENWQYDADAGFRDAAVAAAIVGAWLFVNELWQVSCGNRPKRSSEESRTRRCR